MKQNKITITVTVDEEADNVKIEMGCDDDMSVKDVLTSLLKTSELCGMEADKAYQKMLKRRKKLTTAQFVELKFSNVIK